ncbi:MAG: heme lyase CcmF/NrfE family subunit [Fidelibacterota bacterium]
MAIYGATLLNLALGLAALTQIVLFIHVKGKDIRLFYVGQRMALGTSLLVTLATATLTALLVRGAFEIDYVAHYTSKGTPLLYKFAAVWAGQSGSLLFWLFVLSIYSAVVILQNQQKRSELMPHVLGVLTGVQLFFLFMVNFSTNPFSPVNADFIPSDGLGLNPLLQNVTMAIHPPTLYLGYVGFTVPFAFAIAALVVKKVDSVWVRSIRRWTLFAWLWQSAGIILGGWWAYNELGWGGYWAWDPVENASFMPWLTGTAFVHSIIIQEKKDMLKTWNMILIIVTFVLCIFGTYITRSGAVSSVHAFTADKFGQMFLAFVLIVIGISAHLVISRWKVLKSAKRMESLLSRESGFLFNNVVFVSLCFAILWGTLFPLISFNLMGREISVSIPFYNQIAVPVGLILLTLAGVGPLLAWRRTSRESLIRNFSIPVVLGLIVIVFAYINGIHSIYPLMTIGLSFFVLGTIFLEFYRGIRSRTRRFRESPFIALVTMISRNRSRYGGYIVHFGIVLMFIGFVGKAFDSDVEATLTRGEKVELAGYVFTLQNVVERERSNHSALAATLTVEKDNKILGTLHPEYRIYFPGTNREQQHSELDLNTGILADIYTVFSGADHNRGLYAIKIMINPLVWWVWMGGYFLVAGTLIAIWPRKKKE